MLLVGDANIFIDLTVAGILELFFRLPQTVITPDTLFEEELRRQHADLLEMGLVLYEVEGKNLLLIDDWQRCYGTGPSFNDYLALALAKQESCPLLTGDMALRSVAEGEDIALRGTVFVFEELLKARLISLREAREAVLRMKENRRRLPWKEFDALFARFRTARAL